MESTGHQRGSAAIEMFTVAGKMEDSALHPESYRALEQTALGAGSRNTGTGLVRRAGQCFAASDILLTHSSSGVGPVTPAGRRRCRCLLHVCVDRSFYTPQHVRHCLICASRFAASQK